MLPYLGTYFIQSVETGTNASTVATIGGSPHSTVLYRLSFTHTSYPLSAQTIRNWGVLVDVISKCMSERRAEGCEVNLAGQSSPNQHLT